MCCVIINRPQGLQLPVMGLAFTYPNPVNSLEGSVVKMNEEVKVYKIFGE